MATPPTNPQSPAPPSPQAPPDPRLTRLEEHAAFTEHTVDQLSTEIAALNKRLLELTKKMATLESRLSKFLEEPQQDPD